MSRYDGLIIPRSYSEYINKTDAATLQQALQLSGVLSGTVAAGDNKAVKSDAVKTELGNYQKALYFGVNSGQSITFKWNRYYHIICSNRYANLSGEYLGDVSTPATPVIIKEFPNINITSTTGGMTVEKTVTIQNTGTYTVLGIINYF